jgi:hypothetical protein
MDSAQMFVFDLGWLFFAAWGTILTALGVVAFGHDILAATQSQEARTNAAWTDSEGLIRRD